MKARCNANMRDIDLWNSIGLNILYFRKEQGMTQLQLAEKCNLSSQYIQRIESGATSCRLERLDEIAEALRIPLYKLFQFRE